MPRQPDVIHEEPEAKLPRHLPSLSFACEICTERQVRADRITKLWHGLREFGYANLTHDAVTEAYDAAMAGRTIEGDIIFKLVRSQLQEAGIIQP